MDIDKALEGEQRPDTSFLKTKKTKHRDQIKSPFERSNEPISVESDIVGDVSPQKQVFRKSADPVEECSAATKVNSAAKAKGATSQKTASTLEKLYREAKIIREHGHVSCLYFLLLEKYSSNGKITMSQSEIAQLLAVEKSSVRRILKDLCHKKLIEKSTDFDPASKTPSTYSILSL